MKTTDSKDFKMFNNPFLELLSLSGPKMMITFHLCLIAINLFLGYNYFAPTKNILLLVGVFVAGISIWSLTEYIMHRFVFHLDGNSRAMKAFHYAMHGYHHDKPNDTNRLFMPPVPATLFLALFFGLFYIFLGSYTWFFLPGFELGYLLYSLMHYLIHTRRAPKGLGKLWHHHILHHYNEDEYAFGVSTRIWDRVFNTMPK